MRTSTFEEFLEEYLGINVNRCSANHLAMLAQPHPATLYCKRSSLNTILMRLARLQMYYIMHRQVAQIQELNDVIRQLLESDRPGE